MGTGIWIFLQDNILDGIVENECAEEFNTLFASSDKLGSELFSSYKRLVSVVGSVEINTNWNIKSWCTADNIELSKV